MSKIRKGIVNFHAKMVLLENYGNVNYTGLAKILKKYDENWRATALAIHSEGVAAALFFTTDLISKLEKECENTIDAVFPAEEEEKAKEGREAITVAGGEGIFRNTAAALMSMQEIRSRSSLLMDTARRLLSTCRTLISFGQSNSTLPYLFSYN